MRLFADRCDPQVHAEYGYAGGFMLSETDEWHGQAERILGNLRTLWQVRHLVERR